MISRECQLLVNELADAPSLSTPEDTLHLGFRMAKCLPDNCLVALSGELGTGKTTLVRGIARGLGISHCVHSPTYTIYTLHSGDRQLLHMDAYRLSDNGQLDSLMIHEFLEPPFLIALEWPDRISSFTEEFPHLHLLLQTNPRRGHFIQLLSQTL